MHEMVTVKETITVGISRLSIYRQNCTESRIVITVGNPEQVAKDGWPMKQNRL